MQSLLSYCEPTAFNSSGDYRQALENDLYGWCLAYKKQDQIITWLILIAIGTLLTMNFEPVRIYPKIFFFSNKLNWTNCDEVLTEWISTYQLIILKN